jgi:hypothetical protein
MSLSGRGQHWGSLQELRSFVADCFEASPSPEDMVSYKKIFLLPRDTQILGI